mgnify:FL=1
MNMYNPPHPGEFIKEIYMDPFGLTGRQLAITLNVAPSTLNRILNGASGITSEMAIKLSKAIGRSPESWLSMQDSYDLWIARKKVDLKKIKKIDFDALSV